MNRIVTGVERGKFVELDPIAGAYRELGFTPKQAERRARLTYATYVGLLQMADGPPTEQLGSREIAALVRELRGTLLAPPVRGGG